MTTTIPDHLYLYLDDGERIALPIVFEVCSTCRGHGTSDVFDGGMTASEMHELGEDFEDDYRDGLYSGPCRECHGERVVPFVDEEQLDPETRAAWITQEQARYADRMTAINEQRMCA